MIGGMQTPHTGGWRHRGGAVVVVALAVLVAGCGGTGASSDTATPGTATPTPSPTEPATATPTDGVAAGPLAHGSFTAEVRVDGQAEPVSEQAGAYDLDTRTFALKLSTGSPDGSQLIEVRSLLATDGRGYLQLADWGLWTGCWLPMDEATLVDQTATTADGLPMPRPVRAMLSVSPTGTDADAAGNVPARADAPAVLALLGVSRSIYSQALDQVSTVQVPVTAGLGPDGYARSIQVSGADVADALRGISGVATGMLNTIVDLSATVTLDTGTAPAKVTPPPAAQQLPAGATSSQTCPSPAPPDSTTVPSPVGP